MQFCYTAQRNCMAGIWGIFVICISISLINSTSLGLPQRFQARTSVLRSLKKNFLFLTMPLIHIFNATFLLFLQPYSPLQQFSWFPIKPGNQENLQNLAFQGFHLNCTIFCLPFYFPISPAFQPTFLATHSSFEANALKASGSSWTWGMLRCLFSSASKTILAVLSAVPHLYF